MKKSTIFEICHIIARESKDELTQLGSVIIGPSAEIRSTGYNSFPRGINDHDPSRQERPKKYHYFEHAEANAVHNATRMGLSLLGCTIYVPWCPCSTCARAIIQSGIKKVCIENREGVPDHWKESCNASIEMFNEAGIKVEYGLEEVQSVEETLTKFKKQYDLERYKQEMMERFKDQGKLLIEPDKMMTKESTDIIRKVADHIDEKICEKDILKEEKC